MWIRRNEHSQAKKKKIIFLTTACLRRTDSTTLNRNKNACKLQLASFGACVSIFIVKVQGFAYSVSSVNNAVHSISANAVSLIACLSPSPCSRSFIVLPPLHWIQWEYRLWRRIPRAQLRERLRRERSSAYGELTTQAATVV